MTDQAELNDLLLRKNLDDIKANIIRSASNLRSLAPRLNVVKLFPPRTVKNVERWLEENGPEANDDIRIQMLFQLRDHAVMTELEWRAEMRRSKPRQTRDGDEVATKGTFGKLMASYYNHRGIVTQTYQAAMKMLYAMVKELSQVDIKIHAEGRQTLKMLADTNLKEQEITRRGNEYEKSNGKTTDMRALLHSIDFSDEEDIDAT